MAFRSCQFADIALSADHYATFIYISLKEGVRGGINLMSCKTSKSGEFYTRCLIAAGHYWTTSADLTLMLKWHERWEILPEIRRLSKPHTFAQCHLHFANCHDQNGNFFRL